MFNAAEQTLDGDQRASSQNPNPNPQSDPVRGWETMARAWVSAFPEAKAVSVSQVEAWIDTNHGSLPAELQCMPRSEIVDRLLSIQNYMRPPIEEKEENQADIPPARFQRTDQWIPVYSWLESLNQDEAVKSKDISDWLAANPQLKEQLCSRHSRYHLMHYVKKCHLKILKRREKKMGLLQPNKETALTLKVQDKVAMKKPPPVPSNPWSNLPKDSDMYVAKQKEALRKYETLVELEKKLAPLFSNRQDVKK